MICEPPPISKWTQVNITLWLTLMENPSLLSYGNSMSGWAYSFKVELYGNLSQKEAPHASCRYSTSLRPMFILATSLQRKYV